MRKILLLSGVLMAAKASAKIPGTTIEIPVKGVRQFQAATAADDPWTTSVKYQQVDKTGKKVVYEIASVRAFQVPSGKYVLYFKDILVTMNRGDQIITKEGDILRITKISATMDSKRFLETIPIGKVKK